MTLDFLDDDESRAPTFTASDIHWILKGWEETSTLHEFHLYIDQIWPGISLDRFNEVLENTARAARPINVVESTT